MSDRGFIEELVGDGRALLKLVALVLAGSGVFALFQSATGHFLPQDTEYLGLTAKDLCAIHGCRVVHFMFHDRVSFGGVLLATAVMYLWLAEFPLKRGERWAWWALTISGSAGFLSFLAYLGYGYLDTWHGAATLAILPLFVLGLMRTRRIATNDIPRNTFDLASREAIGRSMLLAATFGIVCAGLVITTVGATRVFVPQDLEFMRTTPEALRAFNPRLVPLIAHDRAGFGGALFSCGLAMFISVLYGRSSRSLWQALALAGMFGFTTAIGIHPVIGYTDLTHLGPAILGALVYAGGLAMTFRRAEVVVPA